MKKRFLAILMVLAMLLSVLPLGVWATEEAAVTESAPSVAAAGTTFALQLAPEGHAETAGVTQLNLYLSASQAAKVGSFQFTLNAAENVTISDYSGIGILGENNVVAYVAENASGTIDATGGSVLLASFAASGDYVPGTSVTLTDIEVNEWNTGATEPGTASITYGQCGHEEGENWTAWTGKKLPSESGYYYLTGDINTGFVTLDGAEADIDITICLNGHNITMGGRGYSLVDGAKVTICDCTAHKDANGDLVAGTIIPGNANGGAFYSTSSSLTIKDVIIDGKGVVSTGDAAAIYSNGTGTSLTLDNVVIRNCTANKYGAIYVTSAALNITDTVIENCTGSSAAVYMYGKTQAALTNVTMTGNTTTGTGGVAVGIFGDSVCTIDGGYYADNTSTAQTGASGAIYIGNNPNSLILKGDVVAEDNICTANDGTAVERNITVQGNSDDITKNPVVTVDGLTDGASVSIYSTTNYSDASFLVATENQTSWDPSWVSYKGYQVVRKDGQFVLSHGHEGDTEDIVWTEWTTGGKLPTESGHYYLTRNMTVGFAELDKTAANGTEIVFCLNGYTMTVGGRAFSLYNGAKVTFCDCTAHEDADGNLVAGTIVPGNARGGIVFNSGAELVMKDLIIDGDDVTNTNPGGVVYMDGNATTTMENVVVRNCTASNGSAISATRGTLNVTDCVFENNTTTGDSGAVIHLNGADNNTNVLTANLTRCTFTDNTAAKAASALYIIRAAANLTDCVITDNLSQNTSSGKYNGALYICGINPTVTLSGTNIIDDNFVDGGTREANVFLQNNGEDFTIPKLYFKDLSTASKLGLTTHTELIGLESNLIVNSGTVAPGVLTYENDGHGYYYDAEAEEFVQQPHTHADDPDTAWTEYTMDDAKTVDGEKTKYLLPSTSGHYYLTEDLSVSFLSLNGETEDIDITICLNGHDIKAAGRAYSVTNGAKVTICDCTSHDNKNGERLSGKLIPGDANGGFIHNTAGIVTLKDVIIDGTGITNAGDLGGGALFNKGDCTTTLNNVIIRNCNGLQGGAIHAIGGVLNLIDTVITDNTSTEMGAVVITGSGTANVSGDTIIDGNVIGEAPANLYLNGGRIINATNLGENARIGISSNFAEAAVHVQVAATDANYLDQLYVDNGEYLMAEEEENKVYLYTNGSTKLPFQVEGSMDLKIPADKNRHFTTEASNATITITGDVAFTVTYGENTYSDESLTVTIENMSGEDAPVFFTVHNDSTDTEGSFTVTVEEAHVCQYEAEVTEPTCTDPGYTTYTCSGCGDSYIADEVEALGHSYETEVIDPTCTDPGYTIYTCSACGDSYDGDEVEASGHSYENGSCTVCGEEDPDYVEIVKFDFAGSTMTLGNELVLNFVYNKALLTGTDNYAKVTIA
ncbi:MAG: hypothetical protein IJO45_06020, partial [Oscillospiraceae bacterium]|nr:hypothetical protein [Oscillospiraceae bacterium]